MRGPSLSPVAENSIPNYRRVFFIGWVFCLGVLPWIMRLNPGGKPEHPLTAISLAVLVSLSAISIPAGWWLGYRHLFAPLFSGKILLHTDSKHQ